jgi:hypothetical protein
MPPRKLWMCKAGLRLVETSSYLHYWNCACFGSRALSSLPAYALMPPHKLCIPPVCLQATGDVLRGAGCLTVGCCVHVLHGWARHWTSWCKRCKRRRAALLLTPCWLLFALFLVVGRPQAQVSTHAHAHICIWETCALSGPLLLILAAAAAAAAGVRTHASEKLVHRAAICCCFSRSCCWSTCVCTHASEKPVR